MKFYEDDLTNKLKPYTVEGTDPMLFAQAIETIFSNFIEEHGVYITKLCLDFSNEFTVSGEFASTAPEDYSYKGLSKMILMKFLALDVYKQCLNKMTIEYGKSIIYEERDADNQRQYPFDLKKVPFLNEAAN